MSSPRLAETPLWDRVSRGYEETAMQHLQLYGKTAIEKLTLRGDEIVLDVGTGPGMIPRQLYDKVAQIEATDFAEKMIELVKEFCEKHHVKNINTTVCNGQNLPFENEFFDLVFCTLALVFFPDRIKGLSEMYRVLKPGGTCSIVTWTPFEKSPATELIIEAVMHGNPELRKLIPQKVIKSLNDPAVLKEEMEEVGFKDIKITMERHPFHVTTPEHFWYEMTEGSAFVMMVMEPLSKSEEKEFQEKAMSYLKGKIKEPFWSYTTAWVGFGKK